MTGKQASETELQAVLETLADPECREILDELETKQSSQEISEQCDLPQTTAYRKLEALADAGLVTVGTQVRSDGHHVKTYECEVTGVFVLIEDDTGFDYEFVDGSTSVDQRLAQFWSRISDEL